MTALTPAPFAVACGQRRPLRLAVDTADGLRIAEGELDQPFALIGSSPGCEIALTHPDVPPRAAALQVIDGETFVVSLTSLTAHPLTAASPFSLGDCALRLLAPPTPHAVEHRGDPIRDTVSDHRPRVRITCLTRHGVESVPLDRRLTFLGDHSSDTPLAYLTLTGSGLYVTDLLSPTCTRVNGRPVRVLRLSDGDELTVGAERYVVQSDEPTAYRAAPNGHAGRLSDALANRPDATHEHEHSTSLVPAHPARVTAPRTDLAVLGLLQQVGSLQSLLLDKLCRDVDGLVANMGTLRPEQLIAIRDDLLRLREVTAALAKPVPAGGVPTQPPHPVPVPDAHRQPHAAPVPAPMTATVAAPDDDTSLVHQAMFERLTEMGDRPGIWDRLRGAISRKIPPKG